MLGSTSTSKPCSSAMWVAAVENATTEASAAGYGDAAKEAERENDDVSVVQMDEFK